MTDGLGAGRTALGQVAVRIDGAASAPRAAMLQLASAGVGITLALLSGCAVFVAASLGGLLDAMRLLVRRAHWILPLVAASTFLVAVAMHRNWSGDGVITSAPWMIAFGVLGLGANGLSALAVFPSRLCEFGAACACASTWAYVVLIVAGMTGVPAFVVVALLGAIQAAGLLLERRGIG